MKLSITDLAGDCFPEEAVLGEYDQARTARIKEAVMRKIETEERARPRSARRFMLTVGLVAAVLAALTVSAFAGGLFRMHMDEPASDSVVSGTWTERREDGSVASVQTWEYPDAGFVFTFESQAAPHRVLFRPGWLPESLGASFGTQEGDGWYSYLSDSGQDREIPYVIQVMYMNEGMTLVLNGECRVVKEDSLGEHQVKEVTCRYYPEYLDDGNYLLMINEAEGYCLIVSGTNSMEDMEHIARELEIRVTDEPAVFDPDITVGQINIGRG